MERSTTHSHSLLVVMHKGTATLEDSCLFFVKLNVSLSYDTPVTLLGIYLNEFEIYVHTETCTWIFITALLIIAEIWMHSRCPSIEQTMVHR